MTLEEKAIELLLRSPRLEAGTILDLLDVGDREFREMARRNATIAKLLEARRAGELKPPKSEPVQCPVCSEWFVPYGSSRFCSDTCRTAGRIRGEGRNRHRRRACAPVHMDEAPDGNETGGRGTVGRGTVGQGYKE